MIMYSHPAAELAVLRPGTAVEHKDLPGVLLVVVRRERQGVSGEVYVVKMPDGKEVPVYAHNLKRRDSLG